MLSTADRRAIAAALLVGCSRTTAARWVGVDPTDVDAAIAADEDFRREVLKNEAGAEIRHLNNVRSASEDPKHWRASIWWLKAKNPEKYDRKAHTVNNDELAEVIGQILETVRDLMPAEHKDELDARVQRLLTHA